MESELRVSDRPELTRPVLVAAFRGWNDGAQAASLAAGYLARLWGADQIADVDPEAVTYEEQVSQAVAADEETAAYVEELERRADSVEEEFELPSGDALAAELTRYLREREAGNGESGPRGPAG